MYLGFHDLVSGAITTAVAYAYEAERSRAEVFDKIDRAKTEFFSNVSHEFRTPLTLMLGPLEDALAGVNLPTHEWRLIDTAHRNSQRLLKLVNSLLDFSRIEAGRAQATYEAVDLAALTASLASNFRSAWERAGLNLVVDCPPLPGHVHVDREMWEKIVLNLLSNAFKFTFEGEIAIRVRAEGGQAMHLVRDGLRPELLVTDHLMPGINGTDLARIVQLEVPGIHVLLVLGYAESEGVDPDLARLLKPFRNNELVASLADLQIATKSGRET